MNYKHANEVMARECEIYKGKNNLGYFWSESYDAHVPHSTEWTIEDPRCREVIRERFKISTTYDIGGFKAQTVKSTKSYWSNGLAEAEIACILAIVENLDEKIR